MRVGGLVKVPRQGRVVLRARVESGVKRARPALSGQLALNGGWNMSEVERGGYEYKLLEAGGWELEQMHAVLDRLSQDGWQLDAAYGVAPDAVAETGPHLWLKRRSINGGQHDLLTAGSGGTQ